MNILQKRITLLVTLLATTCAFGVPALRAADGGKTAPAIVEGGAARKVDGKKATPAKKAKKAKKARKHAKPAKAAGRAKKHA